MKHDRRFASLVLRGVAGLVLAAGVGLIGQARAAEVIGALTPYMLEATQKTGGGWKVQPGSTWMKPGVRSYTASLTGGAFKLSAAEAISIAGRAGALPVAATVGIDLAGAARGVAGCLVGIGPAACGVIGLAVGAYGVYRLFVPEQVPGSVVSGGSLDFDPGQAPVMQPVTQYRFCNGSYGCSGFYSTAQAACEAAPHAAGFQAVFMHPPERPYDTCYWDDDGNILNGGSIAYDAANQAGTAEGCPASIDALNPAYNVPAGSPIGPDGKCPTARYNHVPYTVDEAVAHVVANPPTAAQLPAWEAAVKGAVETGKQTIPAGIEVSGPASQTGTPVTTTTTTSAGTSTQTKTPTYSYTYEGDTINYSTSTTTITNNVDGSTTTVVEGQAQPKPQDPDDPCTANPDRVGCMELGQMPEGEVPKADKDIDYEKEDVGLPEGCPAATVVAGYTVEYGEICHAAELARPWVVIVGVFSALMMVTAALRGAA